MSVRNITSRQNLQKSTTFHKRELEAEVEVDAEAV